MSHKSRLILKTNVENIKGVIVLNNSANNDPSVYKHDTEYNHLSVHDIYTPTEVDATYFILFHIIRRGRYVVV